eukprot:scaffold101062_cov20-Tisochrysis_lutea.AAC.2
MLREERGGKMGGWVSACGADVSLSFLLWQFEVGLLHLRIPSPMLPSSLSSLKTADGTAYLQKVTDRCLHSSSAASFSAIMGVPLTPASFCSTSLTCCGQRTMSRWCPVGPGLGGAHPSDKQTQRGAAQGNPH